MEKEEGNNIDDLMDNLQIVQQEIMDKISEIRDMCCKITSRSEET